MASAPGMISFSAATIWQPLQTPSVNVSLPLEERREHVARAAR